jgi:hypothetical protein
LLIITLLIACNEKKKRDVPADKDAIKTDSSDGRLCVLQRKESDEILYYADDAISF